MLNKLIGLIENNPFFNINPIKIYYECSKTYIEINTALCILIKCYEPNYIDRYNALKKNWNKIPNSIKELEPNLMDKIEKSLKFKLEPIKDVNNVNLEEIWFETKDLLTDLLVVITSHFIKYQIQMDSEEKTLRELFAQKRSHP